MVYQGKGFNPRFENLLVSEDVYDPQITVFRFNRIHGFHDQFFFSIPDKIGICFTHDLSPFHTKGSAKNNLVEFASEFAVALINQIDQVQPKSKRLNRKVVPSPFLWPGEINPR